jgi:hypothetical protein
MVDLHELEPLDLPQRDDSVLKVLDRDRPVRPGEHQTHAREVSVKPAQPSLDRLRRPEVPVHSAIMHLDSESSNRIA